MVGGTYAPIRALSTNSALLRPHRPAFHIDFHREKTRIDATDSHPPTLGITPAMTSGDATDSHPPTIGITPATTSSGATDPHLPIIGITPAIMPI
jgi:hypothetical protein